MIDIHEGFTFEIKRSVTQKEVYVAFHESIEPNALKYRLVVYYDGTMKTEDYFDSFVEGFDSFTSIVKVLAKENDIQ